MCGKMIHFGLIGAGVSAHTHAREMAHVPGGTIEAVYARDASKARLFASKHAIPKFYDNLNNFLADPALDGVIITTPNGLHLEAAVAAAQGGKHVIVEKPLEINESRAHEIIKACQAAGVSLQVIYQRRYADAVQQALDDIAAGRLGNIVLVNIINNQFRLPSYYQKDAWRGTKEVEGGGCVITQATHMIDLVCHIIGPVGAVYARTATVFHTIETEDSAVAILEFANGVMGTLSASTATFPGLKHLLVICGTKGSLILNAEYDQIVLRSIEGEKLEQTIFKDFYLVEPSDPRDYPTQGQRKQLQAIVNNLLSGTNNPSSSQDLLQPVRVIDALYESAAKACRVAIPTI